METATLASDPARVTARASAIRLGFRRMHGTWQGGAGAFHSTLSTRSNFDMFSHYAILSIVSYDTEGSFE
jgi:hypothetical protein